MAEAPPATAPNGADNGSERDGDNSPPPPLPGAAQESGPSLGAGIFDPWEDVPLSLLRLESREPQEPDTQASTVQFGNQPPVELERDVDPFSTILSTLLPRAGGVPNRTSARAEEASSSGAVSSSTDAAVAAFGPNMVNGDALQAHTGGVNSAEADVKGKSKVVPVAHGAEGSDPSEGSSCCICFEKPKDAAFVPCGHRVCYGCGVVVHKQRGNCPMCNKKIDIVLRLFG